MSEHATFDARAIIDYTAPVNIFNRMKRLDVLLQLISILWLFYLKLKAYWTNSIKPRSDPGSSGSCERVF